MKTADFDYVLPEELIAQAPIEPRDRSRLMVVDRQCEMVAHHRFTDIVDYLQPGDLLVFNESRVIPARLYARKESGGRVEVLLLREREEGVWEALCRGKRIRAGARLSILEGRGGPASGAGAVVLETGERGWKLLEFDRPVLALADQVGTTPLPPYIHEPLKDPERYQTVYARSPGSAAAPTAGLHFTQALLATLENVGVETAFVTLHIGLDTFRPVTVDRIENHRMHMEMCRLDCTTAQAINRAHRRGHRIIAVGTTSLRVLESAAQSVEDGNPDAVVAPFEGPTDLFVYPGYVFRAVDTLVTNFHLPRSTLMMLVAAFAGKPLLDRAYSEAIQERYRFYSFGDAMIIL